MITLTDNAAKELKNLIEAKQLDDQSGLRLSVQKGGCAGMQYVMEVAQRQESDERLDQDGAVVFMDENSREYLEGCQVYYEYGLTDSGFKIRNPNASRSCGCGTSFEAKGEEGSYDGTDSCK